MQLKILAVGRKSNDWIAKAEADYFARLRPYAIPALLLVPPADENKLGLDKAREQEGRQLIEKIPTGWRVIACDRAGRESSSKDFAIKMRELWDSSAKTCFLIGGSHGLSSAVLKQADQKISFSKFTFPHELFRVILLEQIYRAFSIINGRKYHK